LAQALQLARQAERQQVDEVARAVQTVASALPEPPATVILSGAGEFLARAALRAAAKPSGRMMSVGRKLTPEASTAACAYALAVLAAETWRP